MRVLLDEYIDWRLSRDIIGHDVKTAHQMEWATIKNGELLARAAEQFDVFITVDRHLEVREPRRMMVAVAHRTRVYPSSDC